MPSKRLPTFNSIQKFCQFWRLPILAFFVASLFTTAAYSVPDPDADPNEPAILGAIRPNAVRSGAGEREVTAPLDPNADIKVGRDKTIKGEEYLSICGQSCAFDTAAEMMTATQVYFQHFKGSTRAATSAARKAKVQACTEGKGACDTDVLDSMTHFIIGKEIRDNFLINATNYENMKSLDYEGQPESNDTGESRYAPWLTGEGTWEVVDKDMLPELPDSDRDHFRFDLGDFEKNAQSEKERLEELDPDFVEAYQNFFNTYRRPEERLFAKARKVDGDERALASDDGAAGGASQRYAVDYDAVENEKGEKVLRPKEINEALAKEVGDGFEKVRGLARGEGADYEQLAARLNLNADSPDGKKTVLAPAAFETELDETIAESNQKFIDVVNALEESERSLKIRDIPEGGPRDAILLALQSASGLNQKDFEDKSLGDLAAQLQSVIDAGAVAQAEAGGAAPSRKYQTAFDNALLVNEQVEKFIEQTDDIRSSRKDGDPDLNRSYRIDVAKFDAFLDQIWPTDASGTKVN